MNHDLNKLEEKIISDGKVLESDILKVDSFLNQWITRRGKLRLPSQRRVWWYKKSEVPFGLTEVRKLCFVAEKGGK